MKTGNFYLSGIAVHDHVFIHRTRLASVIKPGDVIRGNLTFLRTSASYTEFVVTHVAHWGVFAVPVDYYQRELLRMAKQAEESKSKHFGKEWYSKARGHHKFKWCNIRSLELKESI